MDPTPEARRTTRSTRLLYGFGLSAEGVKNNAFNVFLLFYYQQVAGLDPALCGVALFLALCVDALTDPLVGLWSDGVTSRLGRRHPFMYASVVPLSVCFLAVFNPPAGLGEPALFAWLLVFAVGTRFAMTLFVIPHQALVAELSDDYDERTTLQGVRVVFAWLFGLLNALLAYTVFLAPTERSTFDPEGFPGFALWGASAMLVATSVSSAGTQRAALAARTSPARVRRVALRRVLGELREALRSRAYRNLVVAGLFGAVAFGVGENTSTYMGLFFWGLHPDQLGLLIFVIGAASLAALFTARPLSARWGKRAVAVAAAALSALSMPVYVALRFADLLPANGEPALLHVLVPGIFMGYAGTILGHMLIGSMMADVTDEHALRTGARQEGLLYSASTFMGKASSGLGVLVSGLVLRLARFPEDATLETVDPGAVANLGLFTALAVVGFGMCALVAYARYPLTRARCAGIAAALSQRDAEAADR